MARPSVWREEFQQVESEYMVANRKARWVAPSNRLKEESLNRGGKATI
jgi:hypothetical protein